MQKKKISLTFFCNLDFIIDTEVFPHIVFQLYSKHLKLYFQHFTFFLGVHEKKNPPPFIFLSCRWPKSSSVDIEKYDTV